MIDADAFAVHLLEPLLREFVELIGLPSTMAIVEAHGGTLLNIPIKAEQNAALVALVGVENAAALGRAYGPDRPLIPKALPALLAMRNAQIKAELQTMSVRQVARKHKLGERRVWQIAGSAVSPKRGLFD